MVMGEGAGVVVLERLEIAEKRGATIYGEVVGLGSGFAADAKLRGRCDTALAIAMRAALADAGLPPGQIGHIHAHGLATTTCDAEEARAIASVLGESTPKVPVVAAKSSFGNLGASSGLVELIASLLALRQGRLFRTLNYKTPDPACPLRVVSEDDFPAGENVLNLSVTPQGQASAVVVRRL
jgi:3-oxoacyl-[acyl-carrier-protein] synthase II